MKYTKEKYHIESCNLYNIDEKGFILGLGEPRKRIVSKARRDPVFKEDHSRESCTVVEGISAEGKVLPPLIIYRGEHFLCGWFREEKEEVYWYGHSTKGYTNNQLTLEYFEKIFEPETRPK